MTWMKIYEARKDRPKGGKLTFRQKVFCAIGWHDWTAWSAVGKVTTLIGSGFAGSLDPPSEQGKWIHNGELVQARTCIRCGLEKRRFVLVASL